MFGTLLRTAAAVILVAAVTMPQARAQKPAGLALEVVGEVSPPLAPFTEITDGTVLALGTGGRLTFAHYNTCREVTVAGGELAIGRLWYDVAGGRIEREAQQDCPKEIRAQRSGGQAGGLVLRAGPSGRELPTRPYFVLVGRRAGDITGVIVTRGGKTVADLPLDGRRFSWPDHLPALKHRGDYRLVLRGRDGSDAFSLDFIASKTKDTDRPRPLTLLRVD
ncbi:MAG: hypothetical protein ACE5JZ_02915 [Kiloniellales bacterium]